VTQERIILKGVSRDFVKRSDLTTEARRGSMKKLHVCGSFRFTREMEGLENALKEENIQFQVSKKTDSRGILGCLKKVDAADVVYVVNPQGYIGRSVSVDIGYAYAKKKSIYVMHAVDDPPIMNLINDVLSPKALISFLKESSPKRH
jgi:hypothetical protein